MPSRAAIFAAVIGSIDPALFTPSVTRMMMRLCVPHMIARGGGDIANISTDYVLPRRRDGVNAPDTDLYNASKWALNGLTMLQATQLAGSVAVNAFDPGWVKTDLGGPKAPGSPVQSADGALSVNNRPHDLVVVPVG